RIPHSLSLASASKTIATGTSTSGCWTASAARPRNPRRVSIRYEYMTAECKLHRKNVFKLFRISQPRCNLAPRLVQNLEPDVLEGDLVAFGFQSDIPLPEPDAGQVVDHLAVHRERDAVALRRDLVVVPLAGRLDAVLLHLLHQVEAAECAVGDGGAEEISAGRARLRLVPDLALFREAHSDAAVVPPFARGARREAPIHVEDEVGQFLVVAEPLVAAIARADERLLRGVHAPLHLGIHSAD